MDLIQFLIAAKTLQHEKRNWRYGQACFNLLYDLRPDLSEQIRGTEKDPFHVKDNTREDDYRWKNFLSFLAEQKEI